MGVPGLVPRCGPSGVSSPLSSSRIPPRPIKVGERGASLLPSPMRRLEGDAGAGRGASLLLREEAS